MYLVVISYSEDEVYFHETLEDLLVFWEVSSIQELLEKENKFTIFSKCTIYKISDIYKYGC